MRQITKKDIEAAKDAASYLDLDLDLEVEGTPSSEEGWGEAPTQSPCPRAEAEAVVLTTGERGYVRKELAKLLGFHENNTGHRFRQILADYAPNSLSELDKFDSPICLPNGRRAQFFPAGVITMIASGVIDAALSRTLHRARQKLVPNCMKIMRALATTGEVALMTAVPTAPSSPTPSIPTASRPKTAAVASTCWSRRISVR
jgi:hypothetical protein